MKMVLFIIVWTKKEILNTIMESSLIETKMAFPWKEMLHSALEAILPKHSARMVLRNMHGDMDVLVFIEPKKGDKSYLEMKHYLINCVRSWLHFLQENLLLKRLEESFLLRACRMLMLLGLVLLWKSELAIKLDTKETHLSDGWEEKWSMILLM